MLRPHETPALAVSQTAYANAIAIDSARAFSPTTPVIMPPMVCLLRLALQFCFEQ